MPRIRVKYVDGEEVEVDAEEWSDLRPQGIDEIAIGPPWTYLSGQSVYWVYKENDDWVMGGGPLGYGSLPPEVVQTGHGAIARQIEFAPDLQAADVKLGWWWIDSKSE